MADEVLLRTFALPRPFAPDSPWNSIAAPRPDDEITLGTLAGVAVALQELLVENVFQKARRGPEPTSDVAPAVEAIDKTLREFIDRPNSRTIGPQFAFEEFTIPIFEADSAAGTFSCPMQSYDGFCCAACDNRCRPTTFADSEITSQVNPNCSRCADLQRQRVVNGLPVIVKDGTTTGAVVRPSEPTGPGSDGSCVLVDRAKHQSYDFWQAAVRFDEEAAPEGGGLIGPKILSAGGIARFDLRCSGTQVLAPPALGRSARATGTPLLAGLLLPEDLAAGRDSRVEHAFAFAMPRARFDGTPPAGFPNVVYPASNTERTNALKTRFLLAGGQRILLNDTVLDGLGRPVAWQDSTAVPAIVRILFTALRTYGAFLVDGSGGLSFYAEDYHTANWHTAGWQPVPAGEPPQLPTGTMERIFELLFLDKERPEAFPNTLPESWPQPGEDEPPRTMTPWWLLMLGLDDLLTFRLGRYAAEPKNAGLPFSVEVDGKTHFNFRLAEDLPTPAALPPCPPSA